MTTRELDILKLIAKGNANKEIAAQLSIAEDTVKADTGQLVSPENQAVATEVLSMYTTGLGDGDVLPPQVAIGDRLGEILFFGSAPGYPGYNQVNFRLPKGVAPGLAVSVRLTSLGRASNEVTIALR